MLSSIGQDKGCWAASRTFNWMNGAGSLQAEEYYRLRTGWKIEKPTSKAVGVQRCKDGRRIYARHANIPTTGGIYSEVDMWVEPAFGIPSTTSVLLVLG